jgi:hypothetical protein
MRKVTAALFALSLSLGLVACGGDDTDANTPETGELDDGGTGTGNEGGTDTGAGGTDTGGD